MNLKIYKLSFLVFVLLIFSHSSEVFAAKVLKVNGSNLLIKMNTGELQVGQKILAVTLQGKATAIMQITKVKGQGALAKITKGSVEKGQLALSKDKYLKLKKILAERDKRLSESRKREIEVRDDLEEENQQQEEFKQDENSTTSQKEEKSEANKHFFNLKANPFGALIGFLGVEGEIFFSKFGLALSYLNISTTVNAVDVEGTAIGGRLNYYFTQPLLKDSWYLSAGYGTIGVDVTTIVSNQSFTGEVSGSYLQLLAGYVWAWEHFNLALGLGMANYSVDESVSVSGLSGPIEVPISGTGPIGELMMGWAF